MMTHLNTPAPAITHSLEPGGRAALPGSAKRSPRRQRTISRAVHLVVGLVLGTYIYAPAVMAEPLHLALQVIGVPAIVLSGLFLWKQAQIRRFFTTRTRSR